MEKKFRKYFIFEISWVSKIQGLKKLKNFDIERIVILKPKKISKIFEIEKKFEIFETERNPKIFKTERNFKIFRNWIKNSNFFSNVFTQNLLNRLKTLSEIYANIPTIKIPPTFEISLKNLPLKALFCYRKKFSIKTQKSSVSFPRVH